MLAPWKKSYDQPRQHIIKQRHYFTNKGPSSQSYVFSSSHVWMWELEYKESWALKNWCFWTVGEVGEDSWESFGLQGDPTSPSWRRSVLGVHWKDWCWSWNSNTLVTWCKVLTHWKRPCCWERLKAGGEGDDRGWDGWMTSLTQWTWVWARFGSWWWTGKPGVLQSMGSQRVGHDWVIDLAEIAYIKLSVVVTYEVFPISMSTALKHQLNLLKGGAFKFYRTEKGYHLKEVRQSRRRRRKKNKHRKWNKGD